MIHREAWYSYVQPHLLITDVGNINKLFSMHVYFPFTCVWYVQATQRKRKEMGIERGEG